MMNEALKIKRMAEDAAMIADPSRWPQEFLCLKTQPWYSGQKQFGIMVEGTYKVFEYDSPSNVIMMSDGSLAEYSSLEEMVEIWSVD